MVTETIDKLFLELSQITRARTDREIRLEAMIEKAFVAGCYIGYSPNFNLNHVQVEWEKFKRQHMLGFEKTVKIKVT